MLPKKGILVPPGGAGSATRYAEIIALALRTELGDTHRAAKTVRRWTRASERAVKNWFAGVNGPRGDHLLKIIQHSDVALETVLAASRRLKVLELFLGAQPRLDLRSPQDDQRVNHPDSGSIGRSVRGDVPDRDPNRDPEDDPEPALELNGRQRWFLAELANGRRVTAEAVEHHFDVSRKTAKRDIADLKRRGVLCFVGSRRTGRYRLGPVAI